MKPPVSHPYRHPDNLAAVIDLILTCRTEAPTDPWPPVHEIRARLSAQPGIVYDARVWVDDRDHPVAFAMIWEGNIFLYYALPQAGNEMLEMQALAWATERAGVLAEQCGERAMLCVPVRDDDHHRMALLARAGLRVEDMHMIRMQQWLHLPIADVSTPPGFTLRAVAGESEAPALVDLHHAAFAMASETVAERVAWMRSPAYDPRLDLVAVAPNGLLAAFCRGSICTEENTRSGFGAAWIDLIGVHPAYRRQGVGRALLRLALRTMRTIGVAQALLNVGSWNTPAQHLFASCGFAIDCRVFWLVYDTEPEMAV